MMDEDSERLLEGDRGQDTAAQKQAQRQQRQHWQAQRQPAALKPTRVAINLPSAAVDRAGTLRVASVADEAANLPGENTTHTFLTLSGLQQRCLFNKAMHSHPGLLLFCTVLPCSQELLC